MENNQKKLSHSDLIAFAVKYLKRKTIYKNGTFEHNPGCSIVFTELVTAAGETPDAIGFCSGTSFLIEAKTSLSDFYADQKKPWRRNPEYAMGNFKYYICQKGVIPTNKIPEKWGLLEIENNKITITKKAEFSESYKQKEIMMFMSYIRRIENKKELESC